MIAQPIYLPNQSNNLNFTNYNNYNNYAIFQNHPLNNHLIPAFTSYSDNQFSDENYIYNKQLSLQSLQSLQSDQFNNINNNY